MLALHKFKMVILWHLYIDIVLHRNPQKVAISFILYDHGEGEIERTTRLLNKNDTANNEAY